MDINRYIGIPFKRFGRNLEEGVDCYGLVYNFYKNELNIDLPLYTEYDFTKNGLSSKIYYALETMFHKVREASAIPELYDIGLINFAGAPTHVVLYIGDQRILHVMIDEESVLEKLDSMRLRGRWYGWYRKN